MLGAHLLKRAGATLTNFMVVFHATDDDLRAGQRTDGHAVAEMKREGKTFWVSNDAIRFTITNALAVGWRNAGAPAFDASDTKDINKANEAVNKKMDKKTDQLKAPAAPKNKK
jgi:hypothetical protein